MARETKNNTYRAFLRRSLLKDSEARLLFLLPYSDACALHLTILLISTIHRYGIHHVVSIDEGFLVFTFAHDLGTMRQFQHMLVPPNLIQLSGFNSQL